MPRMTVIKLFIENVEQLLAAVPVADACSLLGGT